MPRVKRRGPTLKRGGLLPEERAILRGEPCPEGGDPFHQFLFGGEERELWQQGGSDVVAEWITERPGTRPRAWWRFEAPRWADDPYDRFTFRGTLPEPRRRLGGKGTPVFDCLNYAPGFEFGIPSQFITASDLECFGGLENRTHHGVPVEAYDPKDPPAFESQAKYLWDRDLLEPEERKLVERLGLLVEVELAEQDEENYEPNSTTGGD